MKLFGSAKGGARVAKRSKKTKADKRKSRSRCWPSC